MATEENTTGTEAGNQVIGQVVILYGNVKSISSDGTERVLALNNPIFANDRIITESDGRVSIVIDDTQAQIDLGRMSDVVIDEDIYQGASADEVAEVAAEIDDIQEALLAEEFDPTIELEAAAAGGDNAAGGGHPTPDFVRVAPDAEITSGAETIGIVPTGVNTLEGVGTFAGVDANPDSATTPEDTPITIPVLSNDNGIDDLLTVTDASAPANGSVAINDDGTITYTPDPDYNGDDSFTYTVEDGQGGTDTTTVTVNVTQVNDPPVANDDPVTTPEDTPITIPILNNDSDVDGDTLTVTDASDPDYGTVEINDDGTVTYTPDPDYNGDDSFTYTIDDGQGGTDTATVTIDVTPVNDPPVAEDDNETTPEDTPVEINLPANDTDLDGTIDPTTVTIVDQPSNGTVSVDPVTGVATYTPGDNYNGSDSFTYTVNDDDGATSNVATVTIGIDDVNDPPVAEDDSETTPEDTPVEINLPANDTDLDGTIDPTTVTIVDQPTDGTVSVDPITGVATYTPGENYNGSDSFTYTVQDDDGATSNVATVTIGIDDVNDPPVAEDDSETTPEDTPVEINLPTNDTDLDGTIDPTTVTIVDQPTNGTVSVDPITGVATYTPGENYNGSDSFTYTVNDDDGATSNVATVTIGIDDVNDPPVAEDDNDTTPEDTPVEINLPANDFDLDGTIDPTTVAIVDQPSNGTVSVDPITGVATYTPGDNYNGSDSFTYTVQDDDVATSNVATVTIGIDDVNDPPVAEDDSETTTEDTPVDINLPVNDTDLDGTIDPTTVAIVDQPTNGTVSVNPVTGVATYTPGENYNGSDSFTYTVQDDDGATSNVATVTIGIDDVNDPPVAEDDSETTTEDTPVDINLPVNDTDLDGTIDPTTVAIVDQPTNGTVSVNPVTGVATYTPGDNYNGSDSFTYTVNDDDGATSNVATVTIGIDDVNDPPVAEDDSETTPEDTPVEINLPANDTDLDGTIDPTTVTIVDQPTNGTVSVDPITGVATYTPGENYNGSDSFTYTVNDDDGATSNVATVTIGIENTNENDPPEADPLDPQENFDDDVITSVDVSGAFSDADGDTLTYSADGLPDGLTIDPTTGVISGTIDPSASDATDNNDNTQVYSVTVTATDPSNASAESSFNWTVNNTIPEFDSDTDSGPTPPNADSYTFSAAENTVADTVIGTAPAADVDGDTLTYSIESGNDDGLFAINPNNGEISVTKDIDDDDLDDYSLNIKVDDSEGGTDTATVTISLTNENDPPEADPLDPQENFDADVITSVDVSGAFSDADGDTLTYSADGLPDGLTIDPTTGVISGTIDPSASDATDNNDNTQVYSVTVTATDPSNASAESSFNWTVNNTIPEFDSDTDSGPTPPNADSYTFSAAENTVADTVIGTAPAADVDGDTLTYSIESGNDDGLFAINPNNGEISVTKDIDDDDLDDYSLNIKVDDSEGGTDTATVTISLTNENDPPEADPLDPQENFDADVITSVDVSGAFSDADGDTLTYSADGLPDGLTIDPTTGVISGTIDPSASDATDNNDNTQVYSVTVTATDPSNASAESSFNWTVNNTIPEFDSDTDSGPTPPNADSYTFSAAENTVADTVIGTAPAADVDGDTLTYSIESGNDDGLFAINPNNGEISVTKDIDDDDLDDYSLNIKVDDSEGGTDTATVTISLTNENDPPEADPLDPQENFDADVITSVDVSGAFSDADGDTLTYSADGLPDGLTIDPTTGVISGTIDPSASDATDNNDNTQVYSVTVTATDPSNASAESSFNWTVNNTIPEFDSDTDSGPTPPNADSYTFSAAENTVADTVIGTAPAADVDGDTLTYSIESGNDDGLFAINPNNGEISVTKDIDDDDLDDYSLNIKVDDSEGGTDTATVTISLTNENDPPEADPLDPQENFDADVITSVDVSGAFSDADGDTLTYSADGLPDGLTIDPTTGVISGTIDPSASDATDNNDNTQVYSVTVTATDPSNASAESSFNWTVNNTIPEFDSDTDSGPTPPNADSYTFSAAENTVADTVIGTAPAADVDGDTLTYSIESGNDDGLFAINPNNGEISVTKDIDDDDLDDYSLNIKVDDSEGGTDTATVTISLTNENDPPEADPLDPQENFDADVITSVDVSGAFSDADGDTLTYSADGLPDGLTIDPTTGVISGTIDPSASDATDNNDNTQVYSVTVTATDPSNASAESSFNWTVNNTIPEFDSDTDSGPTPPNADSYTFSAAENTVADTVIGTAPAADVDGDTLTYSIESGNDDGLFAINPNNGEISVTKDIDDDDLDDYSLNIKVDDSEGGTDTATVTISLTNENDPPEADPLDPQENFDADVITSVDVSGAFSDADGDTLTYSADGLPDGLTIDPTTGVISGTIDPSASDATDNNDNTQVYSVTVTATDPSNASAESSFNWTVNNTIPEFDSDTDSGPTPPNADSYTFSAAENTVADTVIGTAPAADVDGDTLTYSIESGNDDGLFAINPNNGEISVTKDIDDDDLDDYSLNIKVDDSEGGTDTATVTISLTNENDPPEADPLDPQENFDADVITSVDVSGAFSDADGDTLTYSADGLPDGLTIDPTTGVISGTIDPSASDATDNNDNTQVYSVTVTATDPSNASAESSFNWTVNNTIPEFDSDTDSGPTPPNADSYTFSAAENTVADTVIGTAPAADVDGDTLTYSIESGNDDGLFAINPNNGEISVTKDIDDDDLDDYSLNIKVDDSEGGTDTATVTISLTNENDPPEADPLDPQENFDADVITSVDVSGAFSDADGDTLTYSADGLPDGLTIDPTTGVISGTIDPSASDATDNNDNTQVYSVTVTATDPSNASAESSFNWTVNNTIPEFDSDTDSGPTPPNADSYTFSAAENTVADTVIGTAPAADVDGDTLTYSIESGNDDGLFAINPNNGEISVTKDIDDDDLDDYSLNIKVDDSEGGTDTATVTISLTNENDPPEADPLDPQENFDADVITSVDVSGAFSDADGDTLTYSADGLPDGLTIDPTTGVISGTIDPSASDATDNNDNTQVYSVTVTATDPSNASAESSFNWTVNNTIPEFDSDTDSGPTPPNADSYTFSAAENTVADTVIGTAPAADVDGDTLTYSIESGNDDGLFAINPNNGEISVTKDIDDDDLDDYSLNIKVDDSEGGTDTATVTISLTNENDPPEADPLDPQENFDADVITSVDVSGAFSDADGDTLTYSADGLPDGLTIDPTTGVISGTIDPSASDATDNNDNTQVYSVTVTATDPSNASAESSFNWTVNNTIPEFDSDTDSGPTPPNADSYTFSAAENTVADTVIGTAPAADVDGDTLTYSIESGNDDGLFAINPNNGEISVTKDIDDDDLDDYSLNIKVDDSEGGTDTATVTISLTNENDPPEADPLDPQENFDADVITSVDVSGAFSDADGDTLTYSADGLPDGLTIDPTTGVISGTIDPSASDATDNNDNTQVYSVTVTATDPSNASAESSFNWTVNNTIPEFDSDTDSGPTPPNADSYTFSAAENTVADTVIGTAPAADVDGDTLTYSIESGNDDGLFAINPNNGEISVTKDIDDDDLDDYSLNIKVDDSEGGTDTATVTISLTNENDPPEADPLDPQENFDADVITSVDVSGAFSDADGDTLTYSADGLPDGLTIDPTTGVISGTIDPSASDATDNNDNTQVYSVTVTATDPSNASAESSFNWTVNNTIPEFDSDTDSGPTPPNADSYTFSAAENTVADTVIGTAPAADVDGDTLTYSIESGNDDGLFAINPNNGEISVTKDIDDDDLDDYSLNIKVDDSEGGTDTATVTISLTNENDPPTITLDGQGDTVYESGLPAGTASGVADITAEGSFTITDSDGLDDINSITIGSTTFTKGVDFTTLDQLVAVTTSVPVDVGYGTIVLTSYSSGTYQYTYTLDENVDNDDPAAVLAGADDLGYDESFDVTVSDGTADASKTITIGIVDDIAIDGSDSVILANVQNAATNGDIGIEFGADGQSTTVPLSTTVASAPANWTYQEVSGSIYLYAPGDTFVTGVIGDASMQMTVNQNGTYDFVILQPVSPTLIEQTLTGLTPGGPIALLALDLVDPNTADTTHVDITGLPFDPKGGVNSSANGMGVDNNTISGSEELVMNFDQNIGDIIFQVQKLSDGDTMTWTAYDDQGAVIANGQHTPPAGTGENDTIEVSLATSITSGTLANGFDTVHLKSLSGDYRLLSMQVQESINPDDAEFQFEIIGEDSDGDPATSIVAVSIDGDAAIEGTDAVDDTLIGTTGTDIIDGGTGDDILTGDTGADLFKVGEGNDTITDYNQSEGDVVDISSVFDDSLGDILEVSKNLDDGTAKLTIKDNTGTIEKGSVSFDNINYDSDLTTGDELDSLLGQVDIDNDGDGSGDI